MAFDFFNDWWKKKMAPQMVSTEGKNPAYTYTPITQTNRPDLPQADPYMMPGKTAAMKQRWEAGEFDTEVDAWEKELDREWLSDAFQSAIPEAPDLPSPPSAPSQSQPGPGSFETLFTMGDPLKRKRRSLEEIGSTA
jgi:hypothetical protein